ncbi:MAG: D-aminoacylase [Tissierellia bacterium]|nr:D-aminoacylase [Tissierellia bacterium]
MYDLVLKDGLIVDGTRKKPYIGSICIKDGKIAEILREGDCSADQLIDCKGKVISPGFIDLHQHSDAVPLNNLEPQSMIHQGVTTEIAGNCGISLFPADDESREEILKFFTRTVEVVPEDPSLRIDNILDYAEESKKHSFPVNIGTLIGHGTLRGVVVGFDDREATPEELEKMKELLEFELKNGAYGMSLGLIYPPSSYGRFNELVELSKVIRDNNGVLTVHMRNESDKVVEAVDEMLQVAELSGVHLHISHLKLIGKSQWGNSQILLDNIEAARQRGSTITCDQYPYQATATGIAALVPGWAQDGGNEKMLERLKEKEDRLFIDIKTEMEKRGGPNCVTISSTLGYLPELDGKTIEDLAEIFALPPEEAVVKVLIDCQGGALGIYHSLDMGDILNIMKDMNIAVGSDGCDFNYEMDFDPHPRSFGTFPRFFQIVREHNLMPIEDAVYKVTGLPASIINLKDRGILKVGNIADITAFDPDEIEDLATYMNPTVKPKGIYHVFVGGVASILDGEQTENRAGRISLKTN